MDIEFLKQRTPGVISMLDRIELRDCDDASMDGQYTVGDVDPHSGDITLVGVGRKMGAVVSICVDETEVA